MFHDAPTLLAANSHLFMTGRRSVGSVSSVASVAGQDRHPHEYVQTRRAWWVPRRDAARPTPCQQGPSIWVAERLQPAVRTVGMPGGSNLVLADHAGEGRGRDRDGRGAYRLGPPAGSGHRSLARGTGGPGRRPLAPGHARHQHRHTRRRSPLFSRRTGSTPKARPVPSSSRSPRIWRRWLVGTSSRRLRRRRSRGLSPAMTLPRPRA